MYRERPSRVPGGFVWTSVSSGDEVRVLPDGCMDLLWDGHDLSIAGADTHAQLFRSEPGSVMTGLRFAPGYAPRVFGVPADELTDQRVDLDSVWQPGEVERLAELLTACTAPGRMLEEIAGAHCAQPDADAAIVEQIAHLAGEGRGSAEIAERVGLSTRQLQRRSR